MLNKNCMSDYSLFDQLEGEIKYEKTTLPERSIEDTGCTHENIITEKGISVCTDCGEEMQTKISHDKEWKYYGHNEAKNISDPNRVQMKKLEERSIYKDVEALGFSESIVSKANKLYAQVTQGKIFRGNSRKAIIFACIFHAYKLSECPQTHEKLIKIFNLDKKTGLKGLKHVNLHAPKNSKIRTTYITPKNMVDEIMQLFCATQEQIEEVLILYEQIKNKSSKLNRSRPQSVTSGLVFYWINTKRKDINLKEFAKKVGLSELTINKISKEISDLLHKKDLILKEDDE